MTLAALVEAYRDGDLTRDELFASVTRLLSAEPGALRAARAALSFDPAVASDFEAWLQGLGAGPQILLGGRRVAVTSALLAAAAAPEARRYVETIYAEGAAVGTLRLVLGSRARVVFMEARLDA